MSCRTSQPFLFFFNDTATTEIYTLSLHDALPILARLVRQGEADALVSAGNTGALMTVARFVLGTLPSVQRPRSEEHTSELQSHLNLVCRLLLEKKNTS